MLYESNPRRVEELLRKEREQTKIVRPRLSNVGSRLNGPTIATTALTTICAGVCVGLPMLQVLRDTGSVVMPPGITDTNGPSSSPQTFPSPPVSPSAEPVNLPPSQPQQPEGTTSSPVYVASVCETQEGTEEGQLPSGEPVLPATRNRPSIFVVSPDRSEEQSFSVRSLSDSSGDWYTVSQEDDVGIVGIATSDTRFKTGDDHAVWGKSCEPTVAAAVDEAASRTDDLCRREELGLRAVVVYHVGPDGKPVEMNRTEC